MDLLQVAAVPKYTSSVVQRHLKGTCPQYQEFANAYGTNSTDEVHKIAAEHHDVFLKVLFPLQAPSGFADFLTRSGRKLRPR